MTKQKKKDYWVQTLYAVICPNGSAENYYYSKNQAHTVARKLNKEDKETL